MTKLVAIGDVHGMDAEFTRLLERISSRSDLGEYQLILLGDLVDGGPNTKAVLDTARHLDLTTNLVALKGNHESMLIDACVHNSLLYKRFDHWWDQGGRASAQSFSVDYLDDVRGYIDRKTLIPSDYLEWLERRPIYYETKNYIFVHAGLRPGIRLEYQTEWDMLWIRDEFIQSDYDFGKKVVFGHTYQRNGPLTMRNKIGIDTMHRGGGYLTAVVLDDDRGPNDAEIIEFIYSH